MLSDYEKDKIREGTIRARTEVPEATEAQIHNMLLYVIARNGTPLSFEEAHEALMIIRETSTEFQKALN